MKFDFDKNEQLDQLIFYDFFGTYAPFSSRDKLVQQMPSLKKEFLNYNTFSKVTSVSDLTKKKESEIMETKYNTTNLISEVEKLDPENDYLIQVLKRNSNEK